MSSNCNRFRFLVQQQFDIDLSTQDERLLNSHLDQCESCAKFQHQLQQVIMAAEEVPLPEEMLPPNPEALARTIMSQLPTAKGGGGGGFFAPLMNLFGGGKKDKAKAADAASAFPHVQRGGKGGEKQEQGDSGARPNFGGKVGKDDDHSGTNARLKKISDKKSTAAAAAASDANRDNQSTTKGLGQALGFDAPNQLIEETPLTLADSIRIRVQEQKKQEAAALVSTEYEPEAAPQQAFGAPQGSGIPANMASPPTMPGAPRGGVPLPNQAGRDNPQVLGNWNQSQPMDQWSEGTPPDTAGDGSWQQPAQEAPANPDAAWGGTWNEPPKGTQPGDSEWGPPPAGGEWNEGDPEPAQQPMMQQQAPAQQQQAWPDQQAPTPTGESWGGNQNWNQGQAAAAPSQPGWPDPPQAPSMAGAPPPQQDAWGQQPPAPPQAPAWGQPPAPVPDNNMMPAAQTAPDNSWGQPPAAPAADNAWGQPPQPVAPENSWGAAPTEAAPPPAPEQAGGWAQPPGQMAAQQPANPTGDWGQPPASAQIQPPPPPPQQQAPAAGWGETAAPAPAAAGWGQQPAPGSNGGWAGDGWGQPPAPANDNGWNTSAPTATHDNGGWGTTPTAPAWGDSGGASWGQSNPQPPAQPQQTQEQESKREKERPAWSYEAEQVETGTWKAFTPGVETLGGTPARASWGPGSKAAEPPKAAAAPDAPAPAPAGGEDKNRWEMPIQERMKMDQQAAAQQAAAQPAAPPPPVPMPAPAQPMAPVPMAPSPMAPQQAWGAAPPAVPMPQQAAPGAPPQNNWGSGADWGAAPAGEGANWGAPPAPPAQPAPTGNPWDVSKIQQWQQQADAAQPAPVAPQQMAQPAPPPAPPQAPPPMPAPQPAPPATAGLFQKFDDGAMDRLFSDNLGISEGAVPAQQNEPPAAPAAPPAPQPTFQAAPPAAAPGQWGAPAPTPMQAPMSAPQISQVQPAPAVGQSFAPPQPQAPEPTSTPRITHVQSKTGQNPQGGPAGLFNLDDSAIDQVFRDNLGVSEAAVPVAAGQRPEPAVQQGAPVYANVPQAPSYPQPAPPAMAPQPMQQQYQQQPPQAPQQWGAPPPMPQQAPAPQAQQQMQQPAQPGPGGQPGGGLFTFTDKMIAGMMDGEAQPSGQAAIQSPPINVNEAVRSITQAHAQIPPPAPTPPPKIEGVGRLDSKVEQVESAGGRIASIGKFILDNRDLETLGKLASSDANDSKMKILTMEAAGELQTLLQHIGAQKEVVGSVIVGHDGLLIANTMPPDMDAESIGVWALGVYMNTEHVIKKMGQDRVHQIVSKTPRGYLVIADFGGGLLVTVSDGKDVDTLIPLMRSITQLVAQ